MKLLAFVDLHGNQKALKDIQKKSRHADMIVCAGDISLFENSLDSLLLQLELLKKPVIIIPGNHEDEHDLRLASSVFGNIHDINNRSYMIGDYLFLGYGGGGFCRVDKKFDKIAKKFTLIIKKNKGKKIILVTHAPPYRTNLDNIEGDSCGNKAIRNFIDKVKPDLVISGHLHENAGKGDKIKNTRLINPGPFGKIIVI
ncbi:MAG TPA: metallophosphoesterase [Candidatus Nanoarchaeia archaeon]|nr:metallophosphoesterase [Candidatus Nanoarchaeia archaeon]